MYLPSSITLLVWRSDLQHHRLSIFDYFDFGDTDEVGVFKYKTSLFITVDYLRVRVLKDILAHCHLVHFLEKLHVSLQTNGVHLIY